MDWFRMYGDMPNDPKIGTLSDAEFRTWVELLCMACKAGRNGNTGLTKDTVNWALRRNVTETFQKLFTANLVCFNEAGEITISAWEKRQFTSDSSTSRVKKCREKQKNQEVKQGGSDETLPKRSSNALDTDTDTDTDTDKKKKSAKPSGVTPSGDDSPVVFDFPLNDGTAYGLTQKQVQDLTDLYPAVNVDSQLRACLGWNRSNPTKRKTRGGILKHINSWLAEKQNSGTQQLARASPASHESAKDRSRREAIEKLTGSKPNDQRPEFIDIN